MGKGAMAKLPNTEITAQDLSFYVQGSSDFNFEMRILARLQALGFDCRHAGTYIDPLRERARQFDIRAVQHRGDHRLSLAVECKNLRANSPLLVSVVPRQQTEAFHQRIVFVPDRLHTALQVRDERTFYKSGEMVGKQTEQVHKGQRGEWIGNDQETFEKLSQALNSAHDLIRESTVPQPPYMRVVIPVLVVPNERLWQVEYAADGTLQRDPRPVSRTTLFVDHLVRFTADYMNTDVQYRISHLEIVTLDGLQNAVATYFTEALFG